MITNTARLFAQLLATLRIETVCDVGSMNGADALKFRRVLPNARIFAFEPNPHNFRLMQSDPQLQAAEIELTPLAAAESDGPAQLYLVKADYNAPHDRRGMSSLYQRTDGTELEAVVPVQRTRLDTFLRAQRRHDKRLALWIDTEGKGYECVQGLQHVQQCAQMIHIEVETTECIGARQRLYPEVRALLEQMSFLEIAIDRPRTDPQFNALYIHDSAFSTHRAAIEALLLRARARSIMSRAGRRILPAKLMRRVARAMD